MQFHSEAKLYFLLHVIDILMSAEKSFEILRQNKWYITIFNAKFYQIIFFKLNFSSRNVQLLICNLLNRKLFLKTLRKHIVKNKGSKINFLNSV